jgi:ABC-type multidrug transport system fused ATPase/permease subunit
MSVSGAALPSTTAPTLAAAESQVDARQAIWLIGRSLAYVAPFGGRFFVKWCFTVLSVLPVLVLPWPLKLLTDNVILRRPITQATVAHFPAYVRGAIRLLEGASPPEIALAVVLTGAVTVVLFGAYGQGLSERNAIGGLLGAFETTDTRVTMSAGNDTATESENVANAAASLASGLFGLIDYRWQLRLSQALNHYYRSQLFDRIKSLPMVSLENRRIGDLIYRVMYDTPMITRLIYDLLLTPIAIFTFLLIVFIMRETYGVASEVIWLALAVLPATFLAQLPFAAMVRRRSAASRIAGAATTSAIEETMTNVFAVQSLGGWARERARFAAASEASFRRSRGQVLAGALVTSAGTFAWTALFLVMSFQVAGHVVDGQLTVGDYAVLAFYYTWMAGSTANLAGMWIRSQDAVVGLRRVFALLDLPAEDDLGSRVLPPVAKGVRFENVSLVYPDGRRAVDEVSLEAKVGEITALVGPTGAGKTSLAYLVPRYHRPTAGRVLIDGVDVAALSLESLRRQVAYVFQETQLFSMSVADNIRYGRPDAAMDAVIEAARQSGADEFVRRLPEGYETQLSGRAAELSVGQRQRLAIARALVCEAAILILDEPTSALDPDTERYLIGSLHQAAQGRCVIVIAHRLTTIAHADKVVVLENGRVREAGPPAALLARPGSAYARFARLQAGD